MSSQFEWGRDFLPHFWDSHQQGEFKIMPQLFRLLNGVVINLDNVTRIVRRESGMPPRITICLLDGNYVDVEESDERTYQQVSAWVESLPSLSLYEM